MLTREEYTESDIFEFLTLLQRNNRIDYETNLHKQIKIEEWKLVVKQLKRQSISLIFSKKNYAMYKCSIESLMLTSILL